MNKNKSKNKNKNNKNKSNSNKKCIYCQAPLIIEEDGSECCPNPDCDDWNACQDYKVEK